MRRVSLEDVLSLAAALDGRPEAAWAGYLRAHLEAAHGADKCRKRLRKARFGSGAAGVRAAAVAPLSVTSTVEGLARIEAVCAGLRAWKRAQALRGGRCDPEKRTD